jgi:hypothetical protein
MRSFPGKLKVATLGIRNDTEFDRKLAGNFQVFEDDIVAMAHADKLTAEGHWHGVELWQGARKLDWPESRP